MNKNTSTKKVYADFECINQPSYKPDKPNVLFKQFPIAVGYFIFYNI